MSSRHRLQLADLLSAALVVCAVSAQLASAMRGTSYTPAQYYRFENVSNATIDTQGSCNLYTRSQTNIAPVGQTKGGVVGNFVRFGDGIYNASTRRTWNMGGCGNATGAKGITIELLLRPTYGCFLRGGSAGLIRSNQGSVSFSIAYSGISWTATTAAAAGDRDAATATTTPGATPTDTVSVSLEGAGVLAADYLWGATSAFKAAWHHIALVKDASTGDQAIWIDGQSLPGMRINGTAPGRVLAGGPDDYLVFDTRNPVALCGDLDEIAVYDQAIPDSLIYQHYQDTIVNHKPYSATDPGTPPPPPPLYPNATNASYYDASEFAPGSVLPTPAGNNTYGATTTCVDQLQWVSDPRYNGTALAKYHSPALFNWFDPAYAAGQGQPTVPRRLLGNITVALQKTLVTRWHYGLVVSPRPPSTWVENTTVALANANPSWPVHMLMNRRSVRPGGTQLYNQSLPNGCWAQNAKGQFIEVTGAVVPAGGKKTLRPMSAKLAASVGCPDSLFNADGEYFLSEWYTPLSAYLTRPANIVNTDGEIFISLMTPAETWDFSADPAVYADYNASGAPNWNTYFSEWRLRLTNGFSNKFMEDPKLAASLFKGAAFTMYQVQGTNPYFGNWTVTRQIGTPMHDAKTGNMTYYSTEDFYLQSPREWVTGGGPDHGIEWLEGTRRSEMSAGDMLYSPFVAAGWSGRSERNVRPAQWLGLLKVMAAWGAEWFYSGFFSLASPFPPSQNWCWQGMAPAYAQAMMTQWASFLYEGDLVMSDDNTTWGMGAGAGRSPLLWAGAPHVVALARKQGGAYLVTATIQKMSNAKLNLGTASLPVRVSVPGVEGGVPMVARTQGSVYVWRNDTGSGTPVVYQLDAWHEASHPELWTSSQTVPGSTSMGRFANRGGTSGVTRFDAEVFEGHLGLDAARAIHTDGYHEGAADVHVAYVDLGAVPNGRAQYLWTGRTQGYSEVRLRVRARYAGVAAGAADVVVNAGQPSETTVSVAARGWVWVRAQLSRPATGAEVTLALDGSGVGAPTVHVDAVELA